MSYFYHEGMSLSIRQIADASVVGGESFAFVPRVCCIEGLTRLLAECPCPREAT